MPELAILVVGRDRVLEVVELSVAAGVRAVIINADGFAESADPRSHELQDNLAALARSTGLLLCGPNCLGVINRHAGIAAFCGPINRPIGAGNVSFISQSGGNCASFIELAHSRNLGMSYVVSSGNEAGLDVCDYLEHIVDDVNTAVICLFIESIRNPRRFLVLAKKATQMGKPIVAVKVGRSEVAHAVALAHTGSLAGPDEAVSTLFDHAGIIRSSCLDEAIDQCSLFSLVPKQRWPRGGRVAVFTIGGGSAGVVADLALDNGLELPVLPESVRKAVELEVPSSVRLQNPFDMPGSYMGHVGAISASYVRACAMSPVYDAVLVVRIMPGPKSFEFLEGMRDIPSDANKPILVCPPIDSLMEDHKRAFMEQSQLTLIPGMRRALKALQAAVAFERSRKKAREVEDEGKPPRTLTRSIVNSIELQIRNSRRVVPHNVTYELLELFGLPIVPQKLVSDVGAALEFAKAVGYPLVAKIINSDVAVHKSELGAIYTNIEGRAGLEHAIRELLLLCHQKGLVHEGAPGSVLVQKMVKPAFEMYLGATVPAREYPPMILIGTGGIYVETIGDIARGIAPMTSSDARALLQDLRGYPILAGLRGRSPYDIDALIDSVVRLSDMIVALRKLVGQTFLIEIDLNPIMLQHTGNGAFVVDAVIALRREGVPPYPSPDNHQGLATNSTGNLHPPLDL